MNAEKTGTFICSLRKEKNLTQQQLAEILNVSDKAISRWETGRGLPDIGNLELLSEELEVSVAEILKGERLKEPVTETDVAEASTASFTLAREFVEKRKWLNIAAGFLVGAMIILLAVIHLTSPIPIRNAENALAVKTLEDKEIVGVLTDSAAGYEISSLTEPDTDRRFVFVSAYDTVWNRWFGHPNRTLISLGSIENTDRVYYYPSEDGDQLIWENSGSSGLDGGVETLPRLVYNDWLVIGILLSLAGIVLCVLFRKKHYFKRVVKIALIPIACTISLIAVLIGNFGNIYNAAYYFSGILLLALLLYGLFLILLASYDQRKKAGSK